REESCCFCRGSLPIPRYQGRGDADEMGHRTGSQNSLQTQDRDLWRTWRRRGQRKVLSPSWHGLRQRFPVPRAHCASGRSSSYSRGKGITQKEAEIAKETLAGVIESST